MAIKPAPDRSDLESKSRDDLQTIAKVKGVDLGARATKAAIIDAIMKSDGEPASAPSRAVRSRRTVATPVDDFETLLGEFASDISPAPHPVRADASANAEPAVAATPASATSNAPSSAVHNTTVDETNAPAPATTRPSRQDRGERTERPERTDRNGPRDFTNEPNSRNRRNRRNRNGRERFPTEAMPGADQPYNGELLDVEGLLDLREDGYGFLRLRGYHPSPQDVYVSINQVRRYGLRKGDTVTGGYRAAGSNEKYPALLRVDTVAGFDPEVAKMRPRFEDLTPLFPDEKLKLETNAGKTDLTPRIVDLIAPIGKGQRGLIVSPPKAGKTTVMKQIAQSIEANNPEVHLMVLLVDERPEEVTDIRRSVQGEVISSTFDRPADEHTHVAELAIERAKRLVEQGRDVVIILDGITRLARAYNLAAPATGRIMSGGVDSGALYPPKKFFGAARNIEEGGSLTILASALVETGSKMDEVIFEEFKGTGNMELRLDRRLAERRLYPAIDVNGSSTRHEELLFTREALPQVWKLRRVLNGLAADGRDAAGLELLIDKLKSTRSNDEFLAEIGRGPSPTS